MNFTLQNKTPFSDRLVEFDKYLFTKLNSLGSENWDGFWLLITDQKHWIPLFLIIFFLIFKAYGWKKGLLLIALSALFVTFSDQLVNLIKGHYQRLRPCSDSSLNDTIRAVLQRGSFSFVSGHSTTSFAMTTFFIFLLREHFKYSKFLIIWPILFASSRVYIGVHFPLDIFTGMYLGIFEGFLFWRLTQIALQKFEGLKVT